MTLEKSCEKEADPPENNICSDCPDCDFEATLVVGRCDENSPVKSQDGSLDDRHGTCMHDLQHEHDLAIRQQLFGSRKLWDSSFGVFRSIYFLLTDAADRDSDNVVDSHT